MNEIFKNTCYVCGIISAVSITLCILKGSFGYLFRPRLVMPAMEGLEMPSAPLPVGTPEEVIRQAEETLLGGIECGNCHLEIRTSPVSVKVEGSDEKVIFRCEHCGTDVAIPA